MVGLNYPWDFGAVLSLLSEDIILQVLEKTFATLAKAGSELGSHRSPGFIRLESLSCLPVLGHTCNTAESRDDLVTQSEAESTAYKSVSPLAAVTGFFIVLYIRTLFLQWDCKPLKGGLVFAFSLLIALCTELS